MQKLLIVFFLSLNLTIYSQDDRYLPAVNKGIIIKHYNYIVSYVDKYKQSEWVCYELTKEETKNNTERREGEFLPDPYLETKPVKHSDYTNSGYDRGHLVPAGDMNFDVNAEFESFYTTNISPQLKELNRYTWKRLEDDIRYYVMRNKVNLFIVTGGVLNDTLQTIGYKTKIKVPAYFYKIVYDYTNDLILCVIIPNSMNVEPNYFDYIVDVDDIEKMTRIDFFPSIEDNKEMELEKNIPINNWLKNK